MDPFMMIVAPAGIALVVLLSWVLGGWGRAGIESAEAAKARLALDEPDYEAEQVLLAADGRAALLLGAGGRVAAVIATGDKETTRVWGPGDIAEAKLIAAKDGGLALRVVTTDWTWGTLRLKLTESQKDEAERAVQALRALTPARPAAAAGAA